jgi:GTP-sensing pleiotropic transcriptional regulator CodY
VTQTSASVECQTNEAIFVSKEDYEEFIYKATKNIDIKGDLEKMKTFFLTNDP